MKKEESDMLLGFLMNHIARCLEHQVRVRWEPKTVVIWDVSTTHYLPSRYCPNGNRIASLRTLQSLTGMERSAGIWRG
jgi:alpha-ketoglutarate-dependent taurine dioxygenase